MLNYEKDIETNCLIYKLKDITEVIDNRGKTPPLISDYYSHPIVEVAQLTNKSMIINYESFEKYVSNETYNNFFRNGHLKENDVLISTVGTIGVAAYNFENGLSIAQNVVALRSKFSYYIYCYLICNKKEIINLDIGGVQPSIKIPHLLNKEIKIPLNTDINKYALLFNKINNINKKKQLLIKIKNKFLKKFFN